MFNKHVKHILLLLAALFAVSAMEVQAASVYVIGTGDPAENTRVTNTLTNFGHSVTIGSPVGAYTGGAEGYDVVLLMPNYSWSINMPASGQTALETYVSSGGGLVTAEWTLWEVGSGRFATVGTMLPASSGGYYTSAGSTKYFQKEADPIINYGLSGGPFTFNLTNLSGTESRLTAKDGAKVFYASSYGGTVETSYAGLVGWGYGSGRVISFSTLIAEKELANADYRQLFSNAVNWADNATPVPIPAALWLLGSGLFGLIGLGRMIGQ